MDEGVIAFRLQRLKQASGFTGVSRTMLTLFALYALLKISPAANVACFSVSTLTFYQKNYLLLSFSTEN